MAREYRIELPIDATPEQVWKAISEAEEIQKWFAPIAKVDPGKGGTMFVSWGPGAEGTAQITEWEPSRRLTITMPASNSTLKKLEEQGLPGGQMVVDYVLETKNGKTVLTFVNSGFGDESAWDAEFGGTSIGWTIFLHNMRHIVTYHPGKPITGIMHGVRTSMTDKLEAWTKAAAGLYGPDILNKKTGDLYADGIVEYSEPGKVLLVNAKPLNNTLIGISVMDARGVAMVSWGAILADTTPEQSEAMRADWAAKLEKALSSSEQFNVASPAG